MTTVLSWVMYMKKDVLQISGTIRSMEIYSKILKNEEFTAYFML